MLNLDISFSYLRLQEYLIKSKYLWNVPFIPLTYILFNKGPLFGAMVKD